MIVGELGLPHLVELPARGVGADMIGRASALLVDLQFDTTTRGYRLSPRPGAVAKRAHSLLREDLDALEEAWEKAGLGGSAGSTVKLQSAGPITLAAAVELTGGHRLLTDHGAFRDLTQSLADGLAAHAAEVARRLRADVLIQLDEPSLPAALAGSLRGVSGLDEVRALPEPDALHALDTVLGSADGIVHVCAAAPPLRMLARSTAKSVGFDLSQLGTADLDGVGELVDAGKRLVIGLVPTTTPEPVPGWRDIAAPAVTLADRLGFRRAMLAEQIVTPRCGLAGASDRWARKALKLSAETAQALSEEPESL